MIVFRKTAQSAACAADCAIEKSAKKQSKELSEQEQTNNIFRKEKQEMVKFNIFGFIKNSIRKEDKITQKKAQNVDAQIKPRMGKRYDDEVKRMDILLVRLDGAEGYEMQKNRPCLVISGDVRNNNSETITVAPITSTFYKVPTHVALISSKKNGLKSNSMAMLEQTRTIDKGRIQRYIGTLEGWYEQQINKAIGTAFSLELER